MTERTNPLGQPIGAPLPDWRGAARPPRTPISGRFCRVEPVDVDAHTPALFEGFRLDAEGRNWTYLGYGPFETERALREWMQAACLGDDPLFHTIVDLATGEAVGLASYLRIDPANGAIEVGNIHYSPRLQQKPAATEAMFLLMRRVFDELGYRRYEWKCDSRNGPSRAAAGRLGFRYEGLFRQAVVYKGRNRDTTWFSILDSEWPALKAGFEAWLDTENFDGDGRQRRRLEACRAEAAAAAQSAG